MEAFCHAACRLSNQCRPSIDQPTVDEFRMPAEMSIALSRAHLHARMHVASCWRRVHHRDRPPTYDPHSTRCTVGCHTSRDFVHWRFLDAGQLSLPSVSSLPASKNQNISGSCTHSIAPSHGREHPSARWSFGHPCLPNSFLVSRGVLGTPIGAEHIFKIGNT